MFPLDKELVTYLSNYSKDLKMPVSVDFPAYLSLKKLEEKVKETEFCI